MRFHVQGPKQQGIYLQSCINKEITYSKISFDSLSLKKKWLCNMLLEHSWSQRYNTEVKATICDSSIPYGLQLLFQLLPQNQVPDIGLGNAVEDALQPL